MTLNAANNDITFNSTVNGPFNLILDTGGSGVNSGNIFFRDTVGTYAQPIGAMYIKNANDVTANANIYTTLFVQDAGIGTTKFVGPLYVGVGESAEYVPGVGDAIIKTNRVEGAISVDRLFIDVNLANLTGTVAGISDPMKAGMYIGLLKPIDRSGTHYFNGIDLFSYPLEGVLNQNLLDSILENLSSNYSFGFGYEFLDTGNNEFDYMLLLDPLECEVSQS